LASNGKQEDIKRPEVCHLHADGTQARNEGKPCTCPFSIIFPKRLEQIGASNLVVTPGFYGFGTFW
jgi:endonuclease IV